MSYLVDALKKAERERHAQRDGDLRAAAGDDPATMSTGVSRVLFAAVAALVLFNVCLLAYLFVPGGTSKSDQSAAPAQAAVVANNQDNRPDRDAAASSDAAQPQVADPSSTASSARSQTENPADRTALDSRSAARPNSGRTGDSGDRIPRLPPIDPRDNAGTGGGSVTYAPAPPPADGFPGSAPQITINGQLYSSVPGRSFILVQGQRYHEGERLASGAAVEHIGPDGATLSYRGRRYHVNGPG